MSKLDIKKEWETLNYEMFTNKPEIGPYPNELVEVRELLLFAQVHLSNYETSKTKREKNFHKNMFEKIKGSYFEKIKNKKGF